MGQAGGPDGEDPPLSAHVPLLPAPVLSVMRDRLPAVALDTIAAVTSEVPAYRGSLGRSEEATLAQAVELALSGFLTLASSERAAEPILPVEAAAQGARALGAGEARSGRSMDALLAAYRVGARTAWRGLAGAAASAGVGPERLVALAELVFAYIDQLSAASVSGHAQELAAAGVMRQRQLERLAHGLLSGTPLDSLVAMAERAQWRTGRPLTAVIISDSESADVRAWLDPDMLVPSEEVAGLAPGDVVLLLPEGRSRDGSISPTLLAALTAAGRTRPTATGGLSGPAETAEDAGTDMRAGRRRRSTRSASVRAAPVVGPERPWSEVRESFDRAARARRLVADWQPLPTLGQMTGPVGDGPIDTELILPELIAMADPAAYAALRERALRPLADLRQDARARLEQTLRAWLLHQGRREAVASELFVHPQTVRYRMSQIRDLFGDRLQDPRTVLELTLALTVGPGPELHEGAQAQPRSAGR